MDLGTPRGQSVRKYTPAATPSTPRHLAVFTRSLNGGGGIERVVLNLAGEFSSRGYRVDLLLGRVTGRFVDEIPSTVNVIRLAHRPALRLLPHLLGAPGDLAALAPALCTPGGPRVLGAAPALARYLEQARPAALLSASNYSNVTALLAREIANTHGTRMAVSIHNHLSASVANAGKRALRMMPKLARHFFPRADAVVTVSQGVGDDLRSLTGIPGKRIRTIYNPVITEAVEAGAQKDPQHPWLRPGEPPVILAIGKLKKQKDFTNLLHSFQRVRSHRTARLIILGEGNERLRLLRLSRKLGVAEDVDLHGFRSNPFAFMARASVFVLSSAWEGFGNVLVEAMACGCPVVSTDCPSGPSEILKGGRFGPLVPVGVPDALAAAIERVMDAPPDPGQLRSRAGFFTATSSADAYEKVLFGH